MLLMLAGVQMPSAPALIETGWPTVAVAGAVTVILGGLPEYPTPWTAGVVYRLQSTNASLPWVASTSPLCTIVEPDMAEICIPAPNAVPFGPLGRRAPHA